MQRAIKLIQAIESGTRMHARVPVILLDLPDLLLGQANTIQAYTKPSIGPMSEMGDTKRCGGHDEPYRALVVSYTGTGP